MLIVDDAQIEVFEKRLFEAMQQRVEHAIASTFPEFGDRPAADGTTVSIGTVVERGIENALGVDIGDASDVAAFIALGLALRFSPPRPAADWIQAWLMRPDAPGQTRLRMIESRLRKLAKQDPAVAAIAKRVETAREKMAR
jgi:hypothetical protein